MPFNNKPVFKKNAHFCSETNMEINLFLKTALHYFYDITKDVH